MPPGRHSRPPFLKLPTFCFFLASTLITGCAAARCSRARALMYRNWASRSGCRAPSAVLALPCRLKPSSFSSFATVSGPARCPCRVSPAARFRSDRVVHRNGDSGSPREPGSTSASSAGRSPGSALASCLRPPPGRRARPGGSPPASSSAAPAATICRATPAARATASIPPCPSDRASEPRYSRRCRSSRCGSSTGNFAASASSTSTATAIPHHDPPVTKCQGYLSTNT